MINKHMATRKPPREPLKPVPRPVILPAQWDDRIKAENPGPNELRIILPERVFRGKTYSDLISDWFNWLLTSDPEKHNTGSVAFLRSIEIPSSTTDADSTDGQDKPDSSVSSTYADDAYFPRRYPNNPNVRIGGDRLQISTDQAVFVPMIVAYAEASKPYIDWGLMQEYNGVTIDSGDNPPNVNQLTVNGEPIIEEGQMEQFRTSTPIFTAVVPDTDYGRSAKDFLEMHFPPGQYPVIVEGYFILIRFGRGRYQVNSRAKAGRETHGPYFAELLYEIEVTSKDGPVDRPARNEAIIAKTLQNKIKKGELDWEQGKGMGDKIGVKVTKPT